MHFFSSAKFYATILFSLQVRRLLLFPVILGRRSKGGPGREENSRSLIYRIYHFFFFFDLVWQLAHEFNVLWIFIGKISRDGQ